MKNHKNTLESKTESFKNEVDYTGLNDEQKRVYNAFVFRRAKPYRFEVVDGYGNTVRFMLYTNKNDDGVLHIMNKHYKGIVGPVTAREIVNLCDVIRRGTVASDGNNITYTLQKGGSTLKLIVGLKKSGTVGNILKSFYSNRKTSRTAGSSNI